MFLGCRAATCSSLVGQGLASLSYCSTWPLGPPHCRRGLERHTFGSKHFSITACSELQLTRWWAAPLRKTCQNRLPAEGLVITASTGAVPKAPMVGQLYSVCLTPSGFRCSGVSARRDHAASVRWSRSQRRVPIKAHRGAAAPSQTKYGLSSSHMARIISTCSSSFLSTCSFSFLSSCSSSFLSTCSSSSCPHALLPFVHMLLFFLSTCSSSFLSTCSASLLLLSSLAQQLPVALQFVVWSADWRACCTGDRQLASRPWTRRRWLQTKVLVIDEISMVDGEFFSTLDQIGRAVRRFASSTDGA